MGKGMIPVDFESIYNEYFPKVYNYLYYRLLNRDQTDDLVSEVFTRAFEKLDSYDPDKGAISTWIFTIARNVLTDSFRRRRQVLPLDDQAMEISSGEDVELAYIKSEERKALHRELVKLSDLEREVIGMKFFQEKTNRKIASELNMNESTVSSTVYNTVRKLRKGLAQWEEGMVAL